MATPRGKRARTDTATSGGLALPTTQPSTGASTPAKPPGQALPTWGAPHPALQNQTAASTATKAVAQAATGYLNSGAASQAYYPAQYYNAYYAQQYPAGTAQPGTPGVYTYQQQIQYAHAYQQQQYAQQQAQLTAAQQQPYIPTPTSATATVASRLMPPTSNATMALPKQATTPAQPASQSLDTSSVAQLTDALGSAGVDIRAEEEALARMAPSQQASALMRQDDRSTKQNFLDPTVLAIRVKEITSNHAITATENAQTYIALALQSRLSTLITQIISAVDHRLESQFTRPPPLYPLDPNAGNGEPLPMWSTLVRRDVSKQLQALEKMDREEETRSRRRRKERDQNENTNATNNSGAEGNGSGGNVADDTMEDTEGRKKKKRKVDGPGIMAKNMSDEVQKKMANMTAHAQLGGIAKKYSWMQPGGGGGAVTPTPKPAAATTPTTTTTPKPVTATSTVASTGGTGGFVRPFVTYKAGGIAVAPAEGEDPDERKLTLADVMFVVGRERGHGAGKGSARVWSIPGF
ncbi:hypothetical protein FRB98_002635 [Tulasnella sp. 332]|nr:hypothetical protein FRB98_002635 [Tulasnella sp. 332]